MKASEIKQLIRGAEALLNLAIHENDAFLKDVYFKSSLAFSWFGLEGFVNLVASDFVLLKKLELHEKAFLSEQKIEFNNGDFNIRGNQFRPTRDKLLFLLKRFGDYSISPNETTWTELTSLEEWRNSLVHPREMKNSTALGRKHAERALKTVKAIITLVYRKVYSKKVRL